MQLFLCIPHRHTWALLESIRTPVNLSGNSTGKRARKPPFETQAQILIHFLPLTQLPQQGICFILQLDASHASKGKFVPWSWSNIALTLVLEKLPSVSRQCNHVHSYVVSYGSWTNSPAIPNDFPFLTSTVFMGKNQVPIKIPVPAGISITGWRDLSRFFLAVFLFCRSKLIWKEGIILYD